MDFREMAEKMDEYLSTVPMRKDYRPIYIAEQLRAAYSQGVDDAEKLATQEQCRRSAFATIQSLISKLRKLKNV